MNLVGVFSGGNVRRNICPSSFVQMITLLPELLLLAALLLAAIPMLLTVQRGSDVVVVCEVDDLGRELKYVKKAGPKLWLSE